MGWEGRGGEATVPCGGEMGVEYFASDLPQKWHATTSPCAPQNGCGSERCNGLSTVAATIIDGCNRRRNHYKRVQPLPQPLWTGAAAAATIIDGCHRCRNHYSRLQPPPPLRTAAAVPTSLSRPEDRPATQGTLQRAATKGRYKGTYHRCRGLLLLLRLRLFLRRRRGRRRRCMNPASVQNVPNGKGPERERE